MKRGIITLARRFPAAASETFLTETEPAGFAA
jgi:hypothetical protein